MVARRAAKPAASISTALRISMSSTIRSAPAPSKGERGAAKLGEGRLATLVPWAPPSDHQETLGLQFAQRLPHRRTSHAQLVGQLALRGDAVAGLVLPRGDELPQLIGDLVGDGPGGDRLQQRLSLLRTIMVLRGTVSRHGVMVTPSTPNAQSQRMRIPGIYPPALSASGTAPSCSASARAACAWCLALRLAATLASQMPNS